MDDYEKVQNMRLRMEDLKEHLGHAMFYAGCFAMVLREDLRAEWDDAEADYASEALFEIAQALGPIYERLCGLETHLY